MAYIISSDCMDCGVCEFMCPEGAIFEAKRQFVIRKDLCNDCGICVPYCPARAIVHRDAFAARQEGTYATSSGACCTSRTLHARPLSRDSRPTASRMRL